MILHSHFHFKSFPSHAKHKESERKNAKNNTKRARERTTQRELSQKKRKTQREREKERELRSSQRARERTRAPIQPPTPIYLTPVTPSSARRSPRQTPNDRDREAPRRSRSTTPRRSRSTAPCLRASLSSLFSQFDRIWWLFFLGFVCVSVLRNEWYCNICLATDKLWENVTGFDNFFSGFCLCYCIPWMNDIVIFVWQPRNFEKMWPDLTGFEDFFSGFCLCYCIFVWQPRKYEQQVENVFSMIFSKTQPNTRKYFSKNFMKCNQIHENIFLSGKKNTTSSHKDKQYVLPTTKIH